jgi:hypothetical protein
MRRGRGAEDRIVGILKAQDAALRMPICAAAGREHREHLQAGGRHGGMTVGAAHGWPGERCAGLRKNRSNPISVSGSFL